MAWDLIGNAGTDTATNFVGTTDNEPLVVKTNGAEQVRITPAGNVGIGTPNVPANYLEPWWQLGDARRSQGDHRRPGPIMVFGAGSARHSPNAARQGSPAACRETRPARQEDMYDKLATRPTHIKLCILVGKPGELRLEDGFIAFTLGNGSLVFRAPLREVRASFPKVNFFGPFPLFSHTRDRWRDCETSYIARPCRLTRLAGYRLCDNTPVEENNVGN